MILAQRQTPGEDWVVVGRGDQEEAADDKQQQEVRLGMLGAISDDQRPVRWEGCGGLKRQPMTRGGSGGTGGGGWGWGLEATADDQRPVRWDGRWGLGVGVGGDS